MKLENLKVGDTVILFSLAYVKEKWAKEINMGIPHIPKTMEEMWNESKTITSTTLTGSDRTARVSMNGFSYKPEWIRRRVKPSKN